MVRTKADGGARKATAAKAPRKALAPARAEPAMAAGGGVSKDKYGGGNTYNPQPVPEWQKSVSQFFKVTTSGKENADPDSAGGPSSSKDVDRLDKEEQGGSSKVEDQEMDEREEEQEEEEEEKPASSSSSSKFQRNNCISDDSDED